MSYVSELIKQRQIPELLISKSNHRVCTVDEYEARRKEIKAILEEKEYGRIPPSPDRMTVEITGEDSRFCAGKATLRYLRFIFEMNGESFSFPAISVIPKSEGKLPAFVHISFSAEPSDKYMPTEEIVDRGYAVLSFCYKNVTSDDSDFDDKCAKYLCKSRAESNAPGKIAMWAWAAMRVMDYIRTLDCIDSSNVAVIGHSRLGKTALVAGGFDVRFKYIISNNSGCSGAAISRGKIGESVKRITTTFPFWFCPEYNENADNADNYEFDQNFLLGLSVPRHLLVGSAELDSWADPKSEFLGLASVNRAYAIFGKRGLIHGDSVPTAKTILADGDSAYHIRAGMHYLSREDWGVYMDYIDRHLK